MALGQAQLGGGHLERTPDVAAPGAGGRQAGAGALDDQLALELGQRREDAEHQAAVRGRGAEVGALPGQHLEAHATPGQVMDGVDQVAEVAAETVQLPGDQGVVLAPGGLQARPRPGPVVALAGGVVS